MSTSTKTENSTSRNAVYEMLTARIIETMQKGIIPWHRTWGSVENQPKNLMSHKPYHGFNMLLLGMLPYSNPWYLTIKQCNQLGGHIRKGEHGMPITYWKVSYKLPNGGYTDGKDLSLEQRLSYEKRFLLRYYTVFNVEQCDGIEAHVPATLATTTSFNSIEACEAIVANYTDKPAIKHQGNQPYYAPATDQVVMPDAAQFHSPVEYYQTLFHELAHSTGHAKRLNRTGVTDRTATFGSCEYSKEELIAELSAYFMLNQAGVAEQPHFENTVAYLQSWIRVLQNDPQMIVTASSQAQKVVAYMNPVEVTAEEMA